MYLSQILLIERDYGVVNNTKLSERLRVSKSAVTQSVKRLIKLELLKQDRYGVIKLTESGRVIASQVIKRHYLIEHLLVDVLDYPWEKADVEAMLLQRVVSQDLTDFLCEKFDHPDTCPHGNPFPGSSKEYEFLHAPRLDKISKDTAVTLVRITEEGEDHDGLLAFCNANELRPGRVLLVDEITADSVVVVSTDQQQTIAIPKVYAHFLCVNI